MKNHLFTIFLFLLVGLGLSAQQPFTIDGTIDGVSDGEMIQLFRFDGNVGTCEVFDSIQNGRFHFTVTPKSEEVGTYELSVRHNKYSYLSTPFYTLPGVAIQMTGKGGITSAWHVESPVKDQLEQNRMIESTRALRDEYHARVFEIISLENESENDTLSESEKKERINILKEKIHKIALSIHLEEIQSLKEFPISQPWLSRLKTLGRYINYDEPTDPTKHPQYALAIELMERLHNENRYPEDAAMLASSLIPVKILEKGDSMVDAELYDLDGNRYRLSDFKGKYLLLDFWSSGCGPCVAALPEMKELQETHGDSLTIISLSLDTSSRWKEASKIHEMTWQNLSDKKQQNGLARTYGVNGIPSYVLISPDNQIIQKWTGYRENSLKKKMKRHMMKKPPTCILE